MKCRQDITCLSQDFVVDSLLGHISFFWPRCWQENAPEPPAPFPLHSCVNVARMCVVSNECSWSAEESLGGVRTVVACCSLPFVRPAPAVGTAVCGNSCSLAMLLSVSPPPLSSPFLSLAAEGFRGGEVSFWGLPRWRLAAGQIAASLRLLSSANNWWHPHRAGCSFLLSSVFMCLWHEPFARMDGITAMGSSGCVEVVCPDRCLGFAMSDRRLSAIEDMLLKEMEESCEVVDLLSSSLASFRCVLLVSMSCVCSFSHRKDGRSLQCRLHAFGGCRCVHLGGVWEGTLLSRPCVYALSLVFLFCFPICCQIHTMWLLLLFFFHPTARQATWDAWKQLAVLIVIVGLTAFCCVHSCKECWLSRPFSNSYG